MKKIILLLTLMLINASFVRAETLRFCIEYEEIKRERGELYQYSERYLGIKDVVMEDETVYVLTSIRLLSDSALKSKPQNHSTRKDKTERQKVQLIPIGEDALMAINTSKKAESVAKQIYRIREARISVLSGEAEHAATNLSVVMKRLDQMEQDLASMFVGTTYITRHNKLIEYEVNDTSTTSHRDLLMRFSKFAGPVSADDLSGEPVYLERTIQTELRAESNKKNAPMIPYITNSNIYLTYNGEIIYNQRLEK